MLLSRANLGNWLSMLVVILNLLGRCIDAKEQLKIDGGVSLLQVDHGIRQESQRRRRSPRLIDSYVDLVASPHESLMQAHRQMYVRRKGRIACDAQHLYHVDGNMRNLNQAEELCNWDPSCGGIQDWGCDGFSKGFKFCRKGFSIVNTSHKTPTCIYSNNRSADVQGLEYALQIGQMCDAPHIHPGTVDEWSEAKKLCDANSECVAILDLGCDNSGFQWCSPGASLVPRLYGRPSCVYTNSKFINSLALDYKPVRKGKFRCDAPHIGRNKDGLGFNTGMSLAEAQSVCNRNPACGALYDGRCDGKGKGVLQGISFCRVGFQVLEADLDHDACLYEKKGRRSKNANETSGYEVQAGKVCDAHHIRDRPAGRHWWQAESDCNSNPDCAALYDYRCDGQGFKVCTGGFELMPAESKGRGCVYTRPGWEAPSWTMNKTGCQCHYDESSTECACCAPGACQCSKSVGSDQCAPCHAMYKCVVTEDLNEVPDLLHAVSPMLLSRLNEVMEARTYEGRQSGIKSFLREAYKLPSSKSKVQAVALLDAKLKDGRSADVGFEFPNADEVEVWLASWFLEEELFEHAHKAKIAAAKARFHSSTPISEGSPNNTSPVIQGLLSRGSVLHEKFRKCNWDIALHQFYSTQGGYGNWCGKMPPGVNHAMVSFNACTGDRSKMGKWQFAVCRDSGFDEACSRHDLGAYTADVFGIATQSLCKVDADFKAAREKLMSGLQNFSDDLARWETATIIAANCLFDMMPCLRYEKHEFWDWCPSWSGGYPCKKTQTGYVTHWPMGDYSQFKDDACGPTGCYMTHSEL
jgi:hypothetical protein